MLRISAETNLKPDSVIKSAIAYFTKDYGLNVVQQDETGAELEGAGGIVSITSNVENEKTTVEIVTQQWEDPVKEFMRWIQTK